VKVKIISLLLIALVLITGVGVTSAQEELPTLRIAVLPVLNTLPLYVAADQGFYEEEGVNVELVPFNSARDQGVAFQAEEVDGANTDMARVVVLVNGGFPIRAVRSEPIQQPYFSILGGAGVESLDDLRGQPIAIAENTIIEYLTTELLTDAGFAEDEIVFEEVPDIPVRLQLLSEGQVAAAVLPEPLATLATGAGATVLATDAEAEFVPTVLAFRTAVLEENPDAVRAFLAAFERAVLAINADPETFRDVMVANINIPEPLRETYPVPTFPVAGVPTEDQAQLVVDWSLAKGLIEDAIPYEELVDGSFLPLLTIGQIVTGSDDFSTLLEAISIAAIGPTLETEGPYTVFAPDNDAFATVPEETLASLLSSPISVQAVLSYHVLPGIYTAADLAEMDGQQLPTLLGAPVTITVAEDGAILINDVPVVAADVQASNGVIHVLGGVLLPERPQ